MISKKNILDQKINDIADARRKCVRSSMLRSFTISDRCSISPLRFLAATSIYFVFLFPENLLVWERFGVSEESIILSITICVDSSSHTSKHNAEWVTSTG